MSEKISLDSSGMTNIFLLIFSVFCVIFCTFAFTNLSLRKKTSICIT